MTLKELKNSIINNTFNLSLLVFECSDDTFIAWQYAKEIMKRYSDYDVVHVDSIDDVATNEFSIFEDKSLHLISVEKLEPTKIDIHSLDKVIVICNKAHEMYGNYVVKVDKLQNWQIEDYMRTCLKGLGANEIKWLCEIAKYDIHRLDNEMMKISIFNDYEQQDIFNLINEDNGYIDLCPLDIFAFTNAVTKRDKKTVLEILDNLDYIDVEPMGVVTLLYRNFRNIAQIQTNPRVTAEQLGISQKQFNGIKYYSLNKYTNNELINICQLISSIDYKLKSGILPYEGIIDYLIARIL